MPETLRSKKIRLYNHFNAAMENPDRNPLLFCMLVNNANGRNNCRSPDEIPEEIDQMRERLDALECATQQRITLLEMKVEVISAVIVKLIRLRQ
jgi:hypothetical protein